MDRRRTDGRTGGPNWRTTAERRRRRCVVNNRGARRINWRLLDRGDAGGRGSGRIELVPEGQLFLMTSRPPLAYLRQRSERLRDGGGGRSADGSGVVSCAHSRKPIQHDDDDDDVSRLSREKEEKKERNQRMGWSPPCSPLPSHPPSSLGDVHRHACHPPGHGRRRGRVGLSG